MASSPLVFYRRLLQRRPVEVIIVLLFLTSIILFQFMAPDAFRLDDDPFVPKASREGKLSRRQAIWEVIILQEEVKKLKSQVEALEAEIKVLKAPPNETLSLKEISFDRDINAYRIPYGTFDSNGFHVVNNGLHNVGIMASGREVVSSIKKDLVTLGEYIIKQYNVNPRDGIFYKELYNKAEKGMLSDSYYWTGMFRMIPHIGMEYQLIFRDPSPEDINDDRVYGVTITKPFQPLDVKRVVHLNSKAKTINIILPLQGRLGTFRKFLTNLASVKSSSTFNIHLSVIHMGETGLTDVRTVISDAKKLGLVNVHLIEIDSGTFNKGLAIQRGVEQWKKGNDIMFMCDVDVLFGQDFLQRCALHTQFGKSVYFPIVFSQYNPDVVSFFSKPGNATEYKEPKIDLSHGYWRDYGYGMYCIHQVDYLRIGGHRLWKKDTTDGTWGYEDTYLYNVIAQDSQIQLVRAPDPDIVHVWHPKDCPLTLAAERLKACQSSWVFSEGNHKQLGLLHLKDVYDRFISANNSVSQP